MTIADKWFKEPWIKKTAKDKFIFWGLRNTPHNSSELGQIWDAVNPAPVVAAKIPKVKEVSAPKPKDEEKPIEIVIDPLSHIDGE